MSRARHWAGLRITTPHPGGKWRALPVTMGQFAVMAMSNAFLASERDFSVDFFHRHAAQAPLFRMVLHLAQGRFKTLASNGSQFTHGNKIHDTPQHTFVGTE